MRIFLSSTYEDLKAERSAAIEILERISEVCAMEKFFAANHRSRDECLRRLRKCDAIITIVGDRYGSIDEATQESITENEFNCAEDLGIPKFVFVKVNKDDKWESTETDGERLQKHKAFMDKLSKEITWKPFHNIEGSSA